jgi:rhamnogalacturonan II specific xylosyltransferase
MIPHKNIVILVAAFVSIMLLIVARHHPPSRRKIKEIWHGHVYWEGERDTTMLRSSAIVIENGTTKEIVVPKIVTTSHEVICQPHVVFTTFKCPKCDSLRQTIEDNTLHTWSKMNEVTFKVIANAKTNEHGVPILGEMYTKMFHTCPDAQTYTYVNGDIMATSNFVETIESVLPIGDFLMVGKRTNVLWSEEHNAKHANFNFDTQFTRGALFRPDAQDYFTVTKNAIDWNKIPPFVIGRPGYDNWLVNHIYHNSKVALIDATKTVSMIHQTDSEGNVANGGDMVKSASDSEYNRRIGKGQWDHGCTYHAEWETVRFDGKIVLKNRKSGKVFEALSPPKYLGKGDKLKTTESNNKNAAVEVDNWTVIVTVSIGFDDMFSNWFAFYSKLNLDMNVILIAEDEQIYKKYINVDGIDVWKSQYPDSNDPIALSYDTPQYKKLVSRRAAHLLRVLKVQKRIIYTDIDTGWLSDPRPFFKGDFDLFAQLDGNKYYCTGFIALQRTKNTLSLLEEWNRRLLTNPQLNQPIFNKIIKSITIKHKELPRQEFPSGDLYFGQNKQQNVVIVHNNYIVGKDNKIQRFKEVGLWSDLRPQTVDTKTTNISTLHKKIREKYCLDFKHTSMVYQDVVWQTPKQLCVIKIRKATILQSGLLFNETSAYTFGKWYWEKDTSEISTSSSFLKQSFVSFVQIWQNAMQHIAFDTYPKSRLLCPYLQQYPDIGILVMNNLQRDLIIESCFLPIKRFKIIEKSISATSIAATVWSGQFQMGIVPSNSFTSLGSQTKQGDKVIYIPRKLGTRRSVINEKEVLDLLRRYFGNKVHIYNPKNNWRVDRKVFEQASVIIGPHGGGMANMLFAPVNTTIIEFLPLTSLRSKGENERPCYFGLARGLGFDYHSVEPLDFNFFQQPMTVPLHELEKKLGINNFTK